MNAFNRTLMSRALMIYLPFFFASVLAFWRCLCCRGDTAGREETRKSEKGEQTGAVSRKHQSEKKKSSSVFPSRLKAGTLQCLPFPAVAPLFRATKASPTQVDHYFDIFSLLMNPWKRLPTSVEILHVTETNPFLPRRDLLANSET